MTVRRATVADVPLILQILRATPLPPNESEESIGRLIKESRFIFVDTEAPAVCRMVKRENENFIDIPWWSWLGSGDMEAKIGPIFAATLRALLGVYGAGAALWGIGGQLSGGGQTDDERRSDADTRAEAVRVMMQRDLPINSVVRERALNGKDAFLRSTVGLMAQRAGISLKGL